MHRDTRDALARLSKQRGLSSADLLAELVARREEDEMLEQMNAAYERQLRDDSASEGERLEREQWESTLLDGLKGL